MGSNGSVPFGFEPAADGKKGTLIYYDSFEYTSPADLDRAAALAEARSFSRLVLYPLHEETVKRMTKEPVRAYYKREDALHEWKQERGGGGLPVFIDGWEGKRKKYTPVDAALRFLSEKYNGPYFLLMSGETANQFAAFDSFEGWITKLRLLLTEPPRQPHPRLTQYGHRWEEA